jgi:hypothetical protein
MQYPIIIVPDDASTQLEQLGTKPKFWFEGYDGTETLFKEGYPGSGEHWAEKIACEVARNLGLPHAEYELATWRGRPGVISPNLVPGNARLILGNEVLAKVFSGYQASERRRDSQHTLLRVAALLYQAKRVSMPAAWHAPQGIVDAFGVFVGYLLLDALIGNQDRHQLNWGLIRSPERRLMLAPTFDHASSLGRNESDAVRIERMKTRDKGRSLETYAQRARSGLYRSQSSRKPMLTLEVFAEAQKLSATAAGYWLQRLAELHPDAMATVTEAVPDTMISEPARDFALRLMLINRQRLLALT